MMQWKGWKSVVPMEDAHFGVSQISGFSGVGSDALLHGGKYRNVREIDCFYKVTGKDVTGRLA